MTPDLGKYADRDFLALEKQASANVAKKLRRMLKKDLRQLNIGQSGDLQRAVKVSRKFRNYEFHSISIDLLVRGYYTAYGVGKGVSREQALKAAEKGGGRIPKPWFFHNVDEAKDTLADKLLQINADQSMEAAANALDNDGKKH